MGNPSPSFRKRLAVLISPLLVVGALALPLAVAAQSLRPLGTTTVEQIIGRAISGILGILGSIALLMFVYGGILWMTASGNEEKIKKAKNTIIYAIFGLIMAFLAYAIVFQLMYQILFPQVQSSNAAETPVAPSDQPATNGS